MFYAIYIIILRPYQDVKGNIIEILNEVYYTILLGGLIYVNKKEDWSSLKTNIYMYFMVSNTVGIFLIVFSKKLDH